MAFLLIGLVLLGMKLAEIPPVAGFSWFIILAPFACAVAWWSWADSTGYTERRAMDKMDEKKRQRRIKNLQALGMDEKGRALRKK
jgi:small Trp-rich protein